LTHHLWIDLSDQIHAFLRGITLKSLIEREEVRQIADRQDESSANRIDAILNEEVALA